MKRGASRPVATLICHPCLSASLSCAISASNRSTRELETNASVKSPFASLKRCQRLTAGGASLASY